MHDDPMRQTVLIELGDNLMSLGKQVRMQYDERFVCLTPTLDRVVSMIASERALTVSQLARALFISAGAVTQHLTALEEAGAIHRTAGQDRRESVVRLSPKGQELYTQIRAKRLMLFEHVLGGLEPDELKQLSQLIAKAVGSPPDKTTT